MGIACSKKAVGQCFYFGFRVGKIMETFETNSETCFSNRSYAWTDLESIYYGRGRGMCTNISSHSKVQNIPPVHVMNEMNIILKSPELS